MFRREDRILTPLGLWVLLALAAATACTRDPLGPRAAADPAAPSPARGGVALAADDGVIAFARNVWGDQIFVVAPDGSGETPVTPSPFPGAPVNHMNPEVSSDGTRIVFDRGDPADVYVINLDGTGMTNLTNFPGSSDVEPAWSPDGSRIVFRSNRPGSAAWDLYVMDSDGSNVTRLTTLGGSEVQPTWSPDGTQIAFATDALQPRWILCIVTLADSENPDCLTDTTENFGTLVPIVGSISNPDWGPDGRIALTLNWGECSGCSRNDIFVIDSDFTDPVQITEGYPIHFLHPSWSPDGTRLAYQEFIGTSSTGIGVVEAVEDGDTTIIVPGGNMTPSWGGGSVAPPPPPPSQCSDGTDNDSDGKVDFPDDPGCSGPDDDESNDPPIRFAECSDGIDNDGDGKIDRSDLGCSSRSDDDESDDPPPPPPAPQCSDGLDNDGDGQSDHPADPGCSSADDDSESPDPPPPAAQCSDGIDNDRDRQTDYPDDWSCTDRSDDTEEANLCEQHAVYTGKLMMHMYDIYSPGLGSFYKDEVTRHLRFGLRQKPDHIPFFFAIHFDFFRQRNAEGCGVPNTTYCDQKHFKIFRDEMATLELVCLGNRPPRPAEGG